MTMPRYKTIRKKAFVTPAKTRQTVARRTRQEMQAKAVKAAKATGRKGGRQ